MRKQFLEAGRVVGTHGVKGELRVEPWCDSAAFLAKIHTLYWDRGSEELQVVSSRVHKSLLLLKLEGVDTVEEADALRGRILYLNRDGCQIAKRSLFCAGYARSDRPGCGYRQAVRLIDRSHANGRERRLSGHRGRTR